MMTAATCKAQFKKHKACVVIPVYNNEATVAKVIEDVSAYCDDIIVVNDGSTDNTLQRISHFSFIQLISYTSNAGKGWALRKAFAHAVEKGYEYAVTIDSDGQHFAKDLPVFMEKLATEKNAVILGARNMNQSSVPGGSSFGNKFSNFWFKLETGIDSPDTQSGYRLYPLKPISKMYFITKKYEFEIEVLVRLAWEGVAVLSVPVSVYYAPKEERISHFRPYKDFFRISVLNTILVLITFLYIKPRNFFRYIFVKKNVQQLLNDELFHAPQSIAVKSLSVGFGIFMGIIPIWGFQLVIAIFLAVLLKLNKALVIIAANISVPPMIPVIIFASYKTGALWMGDKAIPFAFNWSLTLDAIKQSLAQYVYGSITLAVLAGAFFGILTFALLKLFSKKSASPVL